MSKWGSFLHIRVSDNEVTHGHGLLLLLHRRTSLPPPPPEVYIVGAPSHAFTLISSEINDETDPQQPFSSAAIPNHRGSCEPYNLIISCATGRSPHRHSCSGVLLRNGAYKPELHRLAPLRPVLTSLPLDKLHVWGLYGHCRLQLPSTSFLLHRSQLPRGLS